MLLTNIKNVLFACLFLNFASLLISDEAVIACQKETSLAEYIAKHPLPPKFNEWTAKLQITQKYFDEVVGDRILNLDEESFGLSFIIIQKSVEVLKIKQAEIKKNEKHRKTADFIEETATLDALIDIEKHTIPCLRLAGKDSIMKFGYISLRTYIIVELVSLDERYDKINALKKLQALKKLIKNIIAKQKSLLDKMPSSTRDGISNTLNMIEKCIAKKHAGNN